MLFMSCVCHVFASVHCCLVVTCWEVLISWLSLLMFNCVSVTYFTERFASLSMCSTNSVVCLSLMVPGWIGL